MRIVFPTLAASTIAFSAVPAASVTGAITRPPCQTFTASIGQASISTLSVRLSRITHKAISSNATPTAAVTRQGTRRAKANPSAIHATSDTEFTMLSPL